jgi:hypothetical protein
VARVGERVEDDDLLESRTVAAREQAAREVAADEAGPAGDQQSSWLEAVHRRNLPQACRERDRSTSDKVRHFTVQREVTL